MFRLLLLWFIWWFIGVDYGYVFYFDIIIKEYVILFRVGWFRFYDGNELYIDLFNIWISWSYYKFNLL